MSENKKQQTPQVQKGQRITGKKASAERYIPFYEFLFFDPLYREMKDKAKILYSYLRKKSIDNKEKTQKFEEGEEGFTKSYRDENGDIFVIADNSELSIILQCHPNRVKDQRDELKKYGLLDEVSRLNDEGNKISSAWYVLQPNPETLSERWNHIEEMKKLRGKMKDENQKKKEKYLAKKKVERAAKKAEKNDISNVNQQNVSYANQHFVGYVNQQNVSKIYPKGFKSNPEPIKSTFNLSISEDIQNSALPIPLKKILDKKIDRLIKFEIPISDIDLHYNAVKDIYPENEYAFVLDSLIAKMAFKPKNFASVMDDWLKRNREKLIKMIQQKKEKKEPIRKEYIPTHMQQQMEELFDTKQKEEVEKRKAFEVLPDTEKQAIKDKQQQEIDEMLKKLRA